MTLKIKKRILVAPLNWGLGHATRCIPIINALLKNGYEPIIASDGAALHLLQKEFPKLLCLSLPSYDITYSEKGTFSRLKLLKEFPKYLKSIKEEKKVVNSIIDKHGISGIISDNRPGVYNKKVPSVYMTHQLQVLSGFTTWISTKLHQYFIKNFDICWVPDLENNRNLSGELGHPKRFNMPIAYMGPLSRFKHTKTTIPKTILVLISGPEPQRRILEEKLLDAFKSFEGKVVFVKGKVEEKQTIEHINNMIVYNFMTTELLEKIINESELIISRPGYTTVMDLAKLNKKAFFIPTPGQFEQIYLAKRLFKLGLAPFCNQDNFKLEKLVNINFYKGLKSYNHEVDYKKLFSFFEGK